MNVRSTCEFKRLNDHARIFNAPVVPELDQGKVMHEVYVSTEFRQRGMPTAAEDILVGHYIALAKVTGGCVHLQTNSSVGSIDQIRRVKAAESRVTAEITPHYTHRQYDRTGTFRLATIDQRIDQRPGINPGHPQRDIATGADADVTIIAPQVEWTFDTTQFSSRGQNTPFDGWKVRGLARIVLVAGVVAYET